MIKKENQNSLINLFISYLLAILIGALLGMFLCKIL